LDEVGGSTVSADTVRIILFVDTQCNGAGCNVSDFLKTPSYLAYNNLVNSGRFRTLHDKIHDINAGLLSDGSREYIAVKTEEVYINNLSIPIEYSGSTGGLTEIKSNNIGMLWISGGSGKTGIARSIRVRYSDT